MNERIIKRLAALCSVKSIVTIVLTAVFAYLAISGQVSQEFIAATMETEKPNIFEEALKPTAPSSPSKRRNVVLGFLLSALLAGGFFTVQFVADDRIRTGEDIERYLNLPTLGMMPQQARGAYAAKGRGKGRRGARA